MASILTSAIVSDGSENSDSTSETETTCSPSRPGFEYLERRGLSCRFLPSLVQLWSLRNRRNRSSRHLRGHYQRRNRNRWCLASCPPEILLSDSRWFPSG